jgi:hypothetical protein
MALLEELMDVMRKRAELEELILMIVCGHPELVSSRWKVALQKEHAMKELYMVLMRPIQLQAQLNPRKRPDEEAGTRGAPARAGGCGSIYRQDKQVQHSSIGNHEDQWFEARICVASCGGR